MNFNDIHFLREILLTNYLGQDVATMQSSTANSSCANPPYRAAAFYESEPLRALYHELGGGRSEGARMGSTVIIPHRTRWAQLWRVTAGEVRVMENTDAETAAMETLRHDKASTRNRLMRD